MLACEPVLCVCTGLVPLQDADSLDFAVGMPMKVQLANPSGFPEGNVVPGVKVSVPDVANPDLLDVCDVGASQLDFVPGNRISCDFTCQKVRPSPRAGCLGYHSDDT